MRHFPFFMYHIGQIKMKNVPGALLHSLSRWLLSGTVFRHLGMLNTELYDGSANGGVGYHKSCINIITFLAY